MTQRICIVDGCTNTWTGRRMCPMHYYRWYRHGDPHHVQQRSTGYTNASGYRKIRVDGHPLAGADGWMYEHRLVLYSAIGAGDHTCHHCSRAIRWDAPMHSAARLVVDHMDHVRDNNTPANLVPSCQPCNAARQNRAA